MNITRQYSISFGIDEQKRPDARFLKYKFETETKPDNNETVDKSSDQKIWKGFWILLILSRSLDSIKTAGMLGSELMKLKYELMSSPMFTRS